MRVRSSTGSPSQRAGDVDEWGRSEHIRALARRLYDPIYRYWFRAEWEGLEKIPDRRRRPARRQPRRRHPVRRAGDHARHREGAAAGPSTAWPTTSSRRMPVVGTLWARAGGVAAHPENAYRLLREQQQLVLVFPEGGKGPGKTYAERYQLRRFGRGGFVEIAMRAGVPVVPIAVVGAEESMPILFKLPGAGQGPRHPVLPDHRQHAAVRAAARRRSPTSRPSSSCGCSTPVHFDVPPDQERYSKSRVMDEAEAIRVQLQETLYDMLRQRRSVWFG